MNTGMQLDSNDEDIIICQNKIKHILLELRDKRRKSRNPEDDEIDCLSDKWNRYSSSHFLPSVRETARKYDVYSMHNALELRETDEQTEEMLNHLSQLQRLAFEYVDIIFLCYIIITTFYIFFQFFVRDARRVGNVVSFCKLCGMEIYGLLELRGHLYSKQHAENEKLLRH